MCTVLIILGFEAELYTLHLKADGLYVIQKIRTINFPTTISELKENGIGKLISNLSLFRVSIFVKKSCRTNNQMVYLLSLLQDYCEELHEIIEQSKNVAFKKKTKTISSITNTVIVDENDCTDYRAWTRKLVFPPPSEDSDSE